MFNLDLEKVEHFQVVEDIVDVLCKRTRNKSRGFFRVLVTYYLGKMASNMRASVNTADRGPIPINVYAINLATSGFGKGYSVNIMEDEFMSGYKNLYMQQTLPMLADTALDDRAVDIATRRNTEPKDELAKLVREYQACGGARFDFDSATGPAVKQLRTKYVLAGSAALSMQIDEIGFNLSAALEPLITYLEMYDLGKIKDKLTKNTAENPRGDALEGRVPANALMFGTDATLFDGGPTEDLFTKLLESGWARRSIFGFGVEEREKPKLTPREIYLDRVSSQNDAIVDKYQLLFSELADPAFHNSLIDLPEDVAVELLTYQMHCEDRAGKLPTHEAVRKAEITHRYFRVLKISGAYAFTDMSQTVTLTHLHAAIKLVEESGEAFEQIMNRPKPWMRLAQYLSTIGREVTYPDMMADLPFVKTSAGQRSELMTLARAWGYTNNMIVTNRWLDNIEFFKGERLEETDLSKITLAAGSHWAYNFTNFTSSFDELKNLMTLDGFGWINHTLVGGSNLNEDGIGAGHRNKENIITGFNTIVLDVDDGVSANMAISVMSDYKFLLHTTKRHTDEAHRFRMIFPTSHILHLTDEEYVQFMQNILEWLPFKIDGSAIQRERRFACHEGATVFENEGKLFDVLDFIPRTSRGEAKRNQLTQLGSLDNLERWFATRMVEGSRNNHMFKYASALVDSGWSLIEIGNQVRAFNAKLSAPLSVDEIDNTIMTSVARKVKERDNE